MAKANLEKGSLLKGKILVERTKPKENVSPSGIIIPRSADKPEKTGTVVKITKLRNPEYFPDLKVGSKVIFGKFQKTIHLEGQEYLIMDEQDILYWEP